MIKVLQLGMIDHLGGIETYLINYYRNIDKNKVQFDFINICSNDLCFQDEIESMGGKVFKVPNYYKHPFKYIKAVKRIIKENDYHIIHCNMNSAVMLYPLIAAKLAGAKTIIAHSHNASSDKGLLKSILHNINKHFIPLFANQYYACSKIAGKWFYSNKNINSSKFKVINNAIDIEKYKFNEKIRKNKRQELNIKDDEILIGHVGRFFKQKNHQFLIDVFSEYHKKNSNSKLILVGNGENEQEIKEKVQALNLSESVLFLGRRNDVDELMMAMDIFILPSLYEGFPLVGVEAQASGLACIFSDTITDEVLLNGNSMMLSLNSSLDEWSKSIDKMILKKNNREELNKCAMEYDIKLNAKRIEKLYKNLNQIKICHFVNGMLNGGVEKVLINYFSHMDNINDYNLHIISQGESDPKCIKEFKELGFTIHNVTKKSESLLKNYQEIMKILKEEKIDIVHCHMTTTNFIPLIYSKLAGIKIRISHSHLSNDKIDTKENIFLHATRLVSRIKFACSKKAANFLFGSGKNVTIINNAIELENFKFNDNIRKSKRKELKVTNNQIVIGHVGRFVKQKNHEFIINLFKKLYKENNEYHLVLIGTGELEEKIKRKVKDLKLEEAVTILGTRDDVNELMQAFDIFILPSLFEGLGIVLIEAQTSGLKCFGANNIPEEVLVTENIKLLELNIDSWKKEIEKVNPYQRKSYTEEISKKGFNIYEEAKRLDQIYKTLIRK